MELALAINHVDLTGNLTRDPEVRMTQSGMAITTIPLAFTERRKNAQGVWEDAPNYIDCIMFGSRGEKVAEHLFKGNKVAIGGRLRWRSWEKDGQRHSRHEVIVEDLEFMSAPSGAQRPSQPTRNDVRDDYYAQPMADEDIPF